MTAAIRPAEAGDLAAVEQLLVSQRLPTAGVAECFAGEPADFVVVPDADGVLAVAGLERCGDAALLRSVAVRPDVQGQGLGHRVVEAAIDVARARGLRELYLLTTTAEHFFPRFGFARIDRGAVPAAVAQTVEFTSACPASAVAMVRALETAP